MPPVPGGNGTHRGPERLCGLRRGQVFVLDEQLVRRVPAGPVDVSVVQAAEEDAGASSAASGASSGTIIVVALYSTGGRHCPSWLLGCPSCWVLFFCRGG